MGDIVEEYKRAQRAEVKKQERIERATYRFLLSAILLAAIVVILAGCGLVVWGMCNLKAGHILGGAFTIVVGREIARAAVLTGRKLLPDE